MSAPQHNAVHHKHVKQHLDATHAHHQKRREQTRRLAEQMAETRRAETQQPTDDGG